MGSQQESEDEAEMDYRDLKGKQKRAALNPLKGVPSSTEVQVSAVQGEIINHNIKEEQESGSGTDPGAGARNNVKQFRTNIAKKVTTARSSMPLQLSSSTSLNSINSQISSINLDQSTGKEADNESASSSVAAVHADISVQYHSLFTQVYQWLQNEKSRMAASIAATAKEIAPSEKMKATSNSEPQVPEHSLALENLEGILSQYFTRPMEGGPSSGAPMGGRSSSSRRRRPHRSASQSKRVLGLKGLRRGSTSESDYTDTDLPVPSADVVLDNSKTLLYSGGEADSDVLSAFGQINGSKPAAKDREYWLNFKSEIVRLTHTLGFKGWRRVPLEAGGEVEVIRLSGALTNAVYVVSPPKNFASFAASPHPSTTTPRRLPPKLLLRIYGPQVEHLIDRENELQVLRRLARRNIGPRVLGTFKNGRFEEYLYARTLTSLDLRVPETSIQIAKRMRELHDGIDVLPEERADGPTLWKNWDKWVNRCERVITWLDSEILSEHNEAKAQSEPWRKRGFVCCVPWATFRATVDKYRQWLDASFGGVEETKRRLIFAHNDTQYGNLLRLQPSGESPLLLPANEHKQLVVIDFEYASPNMRGVEFANHFTEWCYNYHDEERPYGCKPHLYPTIEEQKRFIRAYLTHKPRLPPVEGNNSYYSNQNIPASERSSTITTPSFRPTHTSTSSRIPPFNLDNYTAGSSTAALAEEEAHDEKLEAEVQQLLDETRLWRVANSAQWVEWGIVQAAVPGMEEALDGTPPNANATTPNPASGTIGETETDTVISDNASTPTQKTVEIEREHGQGHERENKLATTDQVLEEAEVDEAADEFDYLAYAQERALFFWADVLSLGFIKEEEIPELMVKHIKSRMIDR